MDGIKNYLLSIICAAVVCAFISMIAGNRGTISSVLKLLSGILMAITIVAPLKNLEIPDTGILSGNLHTEAGYWIEEGTNYADNQRRTHISNATKAYILEKAASIGLAPEVEIALTEGENPKPWAVTICCDAAPYTRIQLSEFIESQLGIPKERQTWK